MRPGAILLAAALTAAAGPAAAQAVGACRNEAQRMAHSFLDGTTRPAPEAGRPADDPATAAPPPSIGIDTVERDIARQGGHVAPAPIGSDLFQGGERSGAAAPRLDESRRDRLRTLVEEARGAADRGDLAGCQRPLNEARTLVREAMAARQRPLPGGSAGSSGGAGAAQPGGLGGPAAASPGLSGPGSSGSGSAGGGP